MTKKVLVTGIRGFVGRYMQAELLSNSYEVYGVCSGAVSSNGAEDGPVRMLTADLREPAQVLEVVSNVNPDVVIHLAGQANVALSWEMPQETFRLNVISTLNLLDAVRRSDCSPKILLVGSSDQYGVLGSAGLAVTEETPCQPVTPYAVSKLAQEKLGGIYCRAYGMQICMTRSFNHGGAGQKEGFLIADFAAGIARVECGLADSLRVGNLESSRDFTHVKDIVRAYRLIVERGRSGQVYNVGSGSPVKVQKILDRLLTMSRCTVPVVLDPARMRPSDTPVICCDHSRLSQDTGWQPELTIDQILSDVLAYYRKVFYAER